jgi:tetratricopeptide (TPR) repeat protein
LAWHWALQTQHFALCLAVLRPLRTFLTATARFQEGIALCIQAFNVNVRAEPKLLANIYLELAYFSRRLDQYRESNDFVTKALQTTRALPEMQQTTIAILCELAHIQTRVGNFAESLRYAEEALKLAEGANDSELIVLSRSRLALAKRFLGNFDEARHLYELVLAYERQRGHQLAMLRTLSDFGRLYNDLHEPHEARALFSEGLELAQSQNLPYELAFMWEGLSQCSYLLADYAKARHQAEQALAQSETVSDTIGVAVQCANLANIHLALKDSDTAERYLRRALEITWKQHELPDTLKIFLIWAKVFRSRKTPAKAAELLSYVTLHPASEFVHKQEARGLLQELGAATQQDTTQKDTTQQGSSRSLEAVVSSLLQRP